MPPFFRGKLAVNDFGGVTFGGISLDGRGHFVCCQATFLPSYQAMRRKIIAPVTWLHMVPMGQETSRNGGAAGVVKSISKYFGERFLEIHSRKLTNSSPKKGLFQ